MNNHQIYTLKGDIRALSKTRITSRRVLSQLQQQSITLTVDLERQHEGREQYGGPLHLELAVYFTSELPIYRQKKTDLPNKKEHFSVIKPHISTLIGLIERLGEGVIFSDGCCIASVTCTKKYTRQKEPYLTFKVTQLKGK